MSIPKIIFQTKARDDASVSSRREKKNPKKKKGKKPSKLVNNDLLDIILQAAKNVGSGGANPQPVEKSSKRTSLKIKGEEVEENHTTVEGYKEFFEEKFKREEPRKNIYSSNDVIKSAETQSTGDVEFGYNDEERDYKCKYNSFMVFSEGFQAREEEMAF